MKVSIIIPVYNVQDYLERCIKSVIQQSYKNLEIILVDDGSKDDSGKLCDKYSKFDNRIITIHKENGGLSSARNAGIEIATGEFISFLDSDDYLSSRCIEKMISLINSYNADIAIVQMQFIPENQNEEYTNNILTDKVLIMKSERAIQESLYQKFYTCCAPAKLYKKGVIKKIRFPVGKLSEDLATCHLFLNNANTIVYSSYCGYYYRQRNSSIMHSFNPSRLDALEWALTIEEFCKSNYPSILNAALCRTFNVAVHLILDLPKNSDMYFLYHNRIWREIKRTRFKVLFDINARKREKIAALISYFGESFMKKIWNSRVAIRKDKIN